MTSAGYRRWGVGGSAGTWVRGPKSQEEAVRRASCKQEKNSMVFVFECNIYTIPF